MIAVALHGFTGRPGHWSGVLRAHEPALSGHAPEVPVPAGWHFDEEVTRLAAAIGALDRPVDLLGYSMGARVALAIAARQPVARLTLVGVNPGLEEAGARAERRARDEVWCAILEERGIEAFARAWEDQPMWASQAALPAAVRERQRAERLQHDPRQLAAALRALGLGAMPPLWDALEGIHAPVDLVAGRLDPTYCEIARRMAARLPRARVAIVDGAGHNVLLERPDALAALLEEREP
ncbi:MAG TPA: alpha/beta fold hydrolase [Kofleriaceae bacterium]|nr:alpha/beta fold hydrolase [Kofleriaceae bacterium]